VEQDEIVIGFLFKTNEKFTETIEKGMNYFYDPTSCLKEAVPKIVKTSYNIVTVKGTAASRVFYRLKAEAVRMGE